MVCGSPGPPKQDIDHQNVPDIHSKKGLYSLVPYKDVLLVLLEDIGCAAVLHSSYQVTDCIAYFHDCRFELCQIKTYMCFWRPTRPISTGHVWCIHRKIFANMQHEIFYAFAEPPEFYCT